MPADRQKRTSVSCATHCLRIDLRFCINLMFTAEAGFPVPVATGGILRLMTWSKRCRSNPAFGVFLPVMKSQQFVPGAIQILTR